MRTCSKKLKKFCHFFCINRWNLPKSGVFLFDDVVVATSQVLLDLHGLPGSQNGEIHSGVSWTVWYGGGWIFLLFREISKLVNVCIYTPCKSSRPSKKITPWNCWLSIPPQSLSFRKYNLFNDLWTSRVNVYTCLARRFLFQAWNLFVQDLVSGLINYVADQPTHPQKEGLMIRTYYISIGFPSEVRLLKPLWTGFFWSLNIYPPDV